jgi:hypothetical protein
MDAKKEEKIWKPIPYILTTFNGDVLFDLPLLVNLNDHSSQMQRMDKKHDGHAWYKVKMTNFNLKF